VDAGVLRRRLPSRCARSSATRSADGKLRIGVKLKGVRKVKQEAFADVAEAVRTQTDVALVYGGTD
jgi:hypothetical protein